MSDDELIDRITVNSLGEATARNFTDYGKVDVQDSDLPDGVSITRLVG